MPKKNYILKECIETCKSSKHINDLISAVCLPLFLVTDRQLACYIKFKCYNFVNNRDTFGRTVLHLAASCGRRDLCLWLCKYTNTNIDEVDLESGYTALHRSILYGQINVAVSLIKLGADLDIRDREDYVPFDFLLRSIEDVSTMRYNDIETQFQNAFEEHLYTFKKKETKILTTEVYTWGTNVNYTSGFGTGNSKLCPEFLEYFEKKNEIVSMVCMHKFHTLFICLSGSVFSCGLGKGGRLGQLCEETALIPQKVILSLVKTTTTNTQKAGSPSISTFPTDTSSDLYCITAAIGQEHSIFLCRGSQVLTCGTNTYHQLGINPSITSVSKPQVVRIDNVKHQIQGVAASTYHSVVWTEYALFSCGLHAGQLGHPFSEEKTIPYFQKVLKIYFNIAKILFVTATEGATVVLADRYVFLLNDYDCQKLDMKSLIRLKNLEECQNSLSPYLALSTGDSVFVKVLKVAAVGGTLDSKKIKSFRNSYRSEELQIALLLSDGCVYLWKEKVTRFIRVLFPLKHEMNLTDIFLNMKNMLICTSRGSAYVADFKECIEIESKKSAVTCTDGFTEVSKNKYKEDFYKTTTFLRYICQVKRIPNSFRATHIYSDPKGDNYVMLQLQTLEEIDYEKLPKISSSTFSNELENLFREAVDYDSVHDIVFKVGEKIFVAHKYILASCSEAFLNLEETDGIVVLENVYPEIFEQILLFAYTKDCCLLHEGPCNIKIQQVRNEKRSVHKSPRKLEDPLHLAKQMALHFKITGLVCLLNYFRYENKFIYKKSSIPKVKLHTFSRQKFKSLYDIKLKCEDGRVHLAHKCVLVARMEYFRIMLCGDWMSISSTEKEEYHLSVTSPVLLEILDFLYTDRITRTVQKKYLNFWCSLLAASDQYIIIKLKEICEDALTRCLDVRNAVDLLIFADAVNAHQLKMACYDFICINLASILYSRCLERLNDTILNDLTIYFKNCFKIKRDTFFPNSRCVFVHSNDCSPEEVIAAENGCQINWDVIYESSYEDESRNVAQKPRKKKKQRQTPKETECSPITDSKSDFRELNVTSQKYTDDVSVLEEVILEESCRSPEEEWVGVKRNLKSVKSRLKINATARESPELLEQKEYFIPLIRKDTSSLKTKHLNEEYLDNNFGNFSSSSRASTSTFNLHISNITPKQSQGYKKRLHKMSQSDREETKKPVDNPNAERSHMAWGMNDRVEAVSFSSIIALEKEVKTSVIKEKTSVIKETKKIEMKPLHFTQMEDRAIEELNTFYNVKNVDDEHISVRRVPLKIFTPIWLNK